jgi:hypothetical protein
MTHAQGLLARDPACLPDFPLDPATKTGARFAERGVWDFRSAARHVMLLPYGRNTDRSDYRLVLEEGRGTCSTKHALLAALAREHGRPVGLRLGIYEMDGRNTSGVEPVLRRHGLDSVPEAHCYLTCQGVRVDLTGAGEAEEPIRAFLHEEAIEPHGIGAYKVERHRAFIGRWAKARNLDPEKIWRAREECIQALTSGEIA